MCGRFALISDNETIAKGFGVDAASVATLPPAVPRYNIAPTQPVLAVRLSDDGQRELTFFRWGLIPSWSKDGQMRANLINARAETVAEKPSFRTAYKRRRCLIPVDGFYEWQRTDDGKQPLFIHAADKKLLGLAGLWELWQSPDGDAVQSCTILTTTPNQLMAQIHNRMPVIIEPEDYEMWLDPGDQPDLSQHLLRPYPSAKMAAYPISTLVNSPRHDSPEILTPI